MVFIEIAPHKEHAGFERWREELYGAGQAISLGLRLLPLLAHQDLYCTSPADLSCLYTECETLLSNIDQFPQDSEVITIRVQNILAAIKVARESDAGIVIW